MDDSAPPPRLSYAFAGAPSGPAYERWREELCRNFLRVDIAPARPDRVDCRLDMVLMPGAAFCTTSGGALTFSRTRELLSDGSDDLMLVSADTGPLRGGHAGGPVAMQRSGICLVDSAVFNTVELGETEQFTSLRIARRDLLEICPRAEDQLFKPIEDQPTLRRTIDRYMALARDTAPRLDQAARQLMGQHLVDLAGLLLGSRPDAADLARQRGFSEARLALMKQAVIEELANDRLTIDLIAARFGVSARHAQRLFERGGTTFTEFVLEQRLLLARRLLRHPHHRSRKITDIVHGTGFADVSYFNRVFRRRFGVTPSEMRDR